MKLSEENSGYGTIATKLSKHILAVYVLLLNIFSPAKNTRQNACGLAAGKRGIRESSAMMTYETIFCTYWKLRDIPQAR